jgi:hypothetical protein
MKLIRPVPVALLLSLALGVWSPVACRGGISFLATQYDVGGTFFPTYSYPQNSIVPWRSDDESNLYSTSSDSGERYYGRDGYALFATRFDFPNADVHPSSMPPGGVFANAFLPITGSPDYPNIMCLPNFVSGSQIYSTRMAGGWAYALIDDPRMQAGIRHWTFDGINYPPADGTNHTGVVPYVKLGVLDGNDTITNANPQSAPAARWGFQVGPNVPSNFRVGVMTDGLDGTQFAPGEVFLTRLVNNVPQTTVSSGPLTRNRYVDLHFFDIVDAQPGDQFLFSAKAAVGGETAAVAGFSFDVITPFTGSQIDLDGNGSIDGNDVLIEQRKLGNPGGLGDVDSSCLVDATDFAAVVGGFNLPISSDSASAIPEPASVLLVVSAWGGLFVRRRRRDG